MMRFLIVAERELRAAARRKATYILRLATGGGFFILLIWLMWAVGALQYKNRVHDLFVSFSVVVFFYCLFIGAIRTADCISSERREGTLGLLFLTNLNSLEIIAGKLCSNALPTVYGLLAIFPMLALPLLMGGVTLDEFARTMLALLDAILFSLGCGFLASVFCRRQFPAVALAMGLALVFGAGTLGAAAIIEEYSGPAWLVHGLSSICPLYTVLAAQGGRMFKVNFYWLSLGNVAILSLGALALATLRLARSWRDRPKAAARPQANTGLARAVQARQSAGRVALRHRLLAINPFYWLTARRQISAPVFMFIVGLLVLITVFGTTPLFIKLFGSQRYAPVLGSLVAWVWTGLAVHLLTLYYAAMIASQSLAEDKQSGALELIFATPVQERTILRGLGMAFWRRMLFPIVATVLVHGYFLWLVMTMALYEPPGARFPPGTSQWEVFWSALMNLPVNGRLLEWAFVMIVRLLTLILPLAVLLWFTLASVGRWLGLRMKHPGFAPLVALALLVIPPTLLISVVCFVAEEFRFFRGSDRVWVPVVFYGSAVIVIAHCFILRGWANRHLQENFRTVVIGNVGLRRRTWPERGVGVLRFTLRAVAFVAVLALLLAGYYGWQNYRSRHAWTTFQTELKQKQESLDLAAVLPPPAPGASNFAMLPEFQAIAARTNQAFAQLVNGLPDLHIWQRYQNRLPETYTWTLRQPAPLVGLARWIGVAEASNVAPTVVIGSPGLNQSAALTGLAASNAAFGPAVLQRLDPFAANLRSLAEAARRPAFQITTNRAAIGVLGESHPQFSAFTRLHFLFTLRSLAFLESGRTAEAGDDLLTSLEFVRLSRQSPDIAAPSRTQLLLVRSFQPLWQGLQRHQWNAAQLAAFDASLAQFNALADYTNAIPRAVRASIELWRVIPESPSAPIQLPNASGGTWSNPDWKRLPRAWWFDNCIQMYHVGRSASASVDAAGDRIINPLEWGEIGDLPLDEATRNLLQMNMRYWNAADPADLAYGQTALNQARVAVALERYRLEHQRYPVSLFELVPKSLRRIPNDLVVNRPLLYERGTNDNFILRGVGQNRLNDRANTYSDDWLWAFPTNAPAAESP